MNALQIALAALGLTEIRTDAKYTAILERALEYIKTKVFEVKYPAMKGRLFCPVSHEAPEGAESITVREWDIYGAAEIIANYADDIRLVDTLVEEFTIPVKSVSAGYSYSVVDLMRAAMAGVPLDQRRAMAAAKIIERGIDKLIAEGNQFHGLKGMINYANVPVLTATTNGTGTRWIEDSKTPAQILKDVNDGVASVRETTKETHSPDTLLLPPKQYAHVMQTSVDTTNRITIAQAILNHNPWLSMIDSWHYLTTGDAAGTGERLMIYEKSPEVLEAEIPMERKTYPPQAKNLAFTVPMMARVGGVNWHSPLAAIYMDGI